MAESEVIDIKANNRVLFVKVRFKNAEKNNEQLLYGQLILIFTNSHALESFNGVISTYSDTYDMELHTNWDKYEEFIVERKWKGHFSINMTNTLSSHLEDLKNDRQLYKLLYTCVINYDYNKLDILLYDIINKVLHERALTIETVIQETTHDDFKAVQDRRNNPIDSNTESKVEAEADRMLTSQVLLDVKPVLAPVRGKPIYALKTGEVIMVRILPSTPRQISYIKLLGLEIDNGLATPIPADIIDIKYGSTMDAYEITVKIDEKIFGKIIESESQIKLRLYDQKIDGVRPKGFFGGSQVYAKMKKRDRATKAFLMILSLFLTVIMAIILYIVFTW